MAVAVPANRLVVSVLGLILLAGCGKQGDEQVSEPAQPSGDQVKAEPAKEPANQAPAGPAETGQGRGAVESPEVETAGATPGPDTEPPTAQTIMLRHALREEVIDRQTSERLGMALRSSLKDRLLSAVGIAAGEETALADSPPPRERLPDPDQLPPILIRLRADDDGGLRQIVLGDRVMQDVKDVFRQMLEIVGDDTGPGSAVQSTFVDLQCDANLKSAHVMDILFVLGDCFPGKVSLQFSHAKPGTPRLRHGRFTVAWRPARETPALAVPVRITAGEDGSLKTITVLEEIDLGNDLQRLTATAGELAEVADSIKRLKKEEAAFRIDLHCPAGLRGEHLAGVIESLQRSGLTRSIDRVDLIGSGDPGLHARDVRIRLRPLASAPGEVEELEEVVVAVEVEELEEFDELEELEEFEDLDVEVVEEMGPPELQVAPVNDLDAAAVQVDLSEFGSKQAPRNDLLKAVGTHAGTGLSGRGAAARSRLVRSADVSQASEKAVAAALKWLAEHQLPDGGWSFKHSLAPKCQGRCPDPGNLDKARNAATAMALLPFLGAGQTHKDGKYKATVKSGLYYLVNHMKVDGNGGSLFESGGSLYSHGLASIALCEAYAMTKDKGLYQPAQMSVNFIAYAQDPVGGGWRYQPRQAGDTSVTSWQIAALKSGHMAFLRIPPVTIKKAFAFLDSVQSDAGANYGYTSPDRGSAANTAIGLLCRMYLGWNKDNPALQRGVAWLSEQGPSKGNLYYNYYATQVMRHWEGDRWKKWNAVMRDQLVDSQTTEGHAAGSWHVAAGDHGSERGGRLYCTAMATMILEVYYRHLPIYRTQAVEEKLPE